MKNLLIPLTGCGKLFFVGWRQLGVLCTNWSFDHLRVQVLGRKLDQMATSQHFKTFLRSPWFGYWKAIGNVWFYNQAYLPGWWCGFVVAWREVRWEYVSCWWGSWWGNRKRCVLGFVPRIWGKRTVVATWGSAMKKECLFLACHYNTRPI